MMAVLASFTLLLFGGMTLPSTYATVAATYPLWDWPLSLLAGLGAVLLTVFVLLFPDGRLALRWPAAVVGVWSLSIMGSYLAPGTVVDSDTYPTIIAGPLFLSVFPALVYSQIYRYRRVSTPVQRQQTKWVVAGIGSAFVVFFATVILGDLPNVNDSAAGVLILPTISYAALAFIPMSIALAVLRYGLWNIDVLINRALVYGSLTLALAAIYLGSVIVISLALRQVAGQDSGLAVAVSTLIVAALFGPLRRRFQAAIDRHFYRQKYNAARTLSTFGSALRDQVDMDELQGSLLSIVHTTMQPAHVSLQIFDGREKR
jgi:hypothetical protein